MTKPRVPSIEEQLPLAVHERLMTIVAIIARQPGIGFEELKDVLDEVTGKAGGWGVSTLHKDLASIKALKLLEPGRHRKGYFLTGPNFSQEDIRILLNGLRIQAEDLNNPVAQTLFAQHLKRFGKTQEAQEVLGFPVEAMGNRPVVNTNTDEFRLVMEQLKEPILRGQKVRLRQAKETWGHQPDRDPVVYPLQFVFHDVAWYLLAENAKTHTFMAMRLDRLSPVVEPVERSSRGASVQSERLALAKAVLQKGWGMAFAPHDAQGQLTSVMLDIQVHFRKEQARFIEENKQRHVTQSLKKLSTGAVVFSIRLPDDRSTLLHFKRWVLSWGPAAHILAPSRLRQEMASELAQALAHYAADWEIAEPERS